MLENREDRVVERIQGGGGGEEISQCKLSVDKIV